MRPGRRFAVAAVVLLLAALLLAPAGAQAGPAQESVFMDDAALVFGSNARVAETFKTLSALGVDRVRVSVLWSVVGQQNWAPYDRIVAEAHRYGIAVLFCVTGPGPPGASSAGNFKTFVTDAGRRYPGVHSWSIWNEPNQPIWLGPVIGAGGVPVSPRLYRGLADAAYAGLRDSGHGGDRILLGETAPRGQTRTDNAGPMRPLLFIRELYCVDKRLRPYSGGAATARGCPAGAAGRRGFAKAHPVLFRASGWAHHPYALDVAPQVADRNTDQVTIASIGRLTKTLDKLERTYGSRRRFPVWLTEYGYQTKPPDSFLGVPWTTQANYLNQADYIGYRNARVRSVAQFLLVDDGPNTKVPKSSIAYWGSTFQSGLITGPGSKSPGVHKPAFAAYQRPIFVTRRSVRRGGRTDVFGQLRTARNGARLHATLEFRATGASAFRKVRVVPTRSRHNYVLLRGVRLARSGSLRWAWRGAGGVQRSRSVGVRVR